MNDLKKEVLILKGDRPVEPGTASYTLWQGLRSVDEGTYDLEAYADVAVTIKNGVVRCFLLSTGRDLASYDVVYLRDIVYEQVRYAIALYLKSKGVTMVNSEVSHFQCTTKLTQNISFALAGVPVADTVYVQPKYRSQAVAMLETTFPVIVKAITGSNGRDNFLIKSEHELMAETKDVDAVIQPFIPNTFDYRIVVGDGQILLGYKRIRDPQGAVHQNNVSQGATGEVVADLPDDVADLALTAAQSISRELCGVDVLENSETGEHVVLEANFNFATPPFDAVTLKPYYKKMSDYLSSRQ